MPKTSKLEPTWTKRVISASKKKSSLLYKEGDKVTCKGNLGTILDARENDITHQGGTDGNTYRVHFPVIGRVDRLDEEDLFPTKKEAGSENGPMISQENTLYANGRSAIIKHEKGKYNLYSHTGKLLGSHPTREKAVSQEQAIEISKHKGQKEKHMDSKIDNFKKGDSVEILKGKFTGMIGTIEKISSYSDKPEAYVYLNSHYTLKFPIESLKKASKKKADTISPESEKKNYFADVDNEIDQDFDLDFPPYLAKDTKMKEIPVWKPNSPKEIEKEEK